VWKWIKGAEMWVVWIVLFLVALAFIGGTLIGLTYGVDADAGKASEVISMLYVPLWIFAAMAIVGVFGIRAGHQAERKARQELADWKARQPTS
jgi:FtsH-binding integral membrane protein